MKIRTNCMLSFLTYLVSKQLNYLVSACTKAGHGKLLNGQSSAFHERNNSLARRRNSTIPPVDSKVRNISILLLYFFRAMPVLLHASDYENIP